jgi:hypothetical protein
MTDRETMQLALDALLTNMDAHLGMADKMYAASHAISALRKQLQQPERRALTDYGLHGLLLGIDPEMKRLPIGFKKFARAIEAAHGIKETE